MSTPAQQQQMAAFILSVEARRDKAGNLAVYKLPVADGGGSFEVAGINDRYHPTVARELAALLASKRYAQAELRVTDYLIEYTDTVRRWTKTAALEAFLRDCVFNRGAKGALRILQLALKVADDGKFGPVTVAALALAEQRPAALLKELRAAREKYEKRVAPPVGARAKFWAGLVNRWDKALLFAQGFLN